VTENLGSGAVHTVATISNIAGLDRT